jgi:hypothetical protein
MVFEASRIAIASKVESARSTAHSDSIDMIAAIRALYLAPRIRVTNQYPVSASGVVQAGQTLVRIPSGKLVLI